MVLSDRTIAALCRTSRPMIAPFHEEKISTDESGRKIPSYGLSSFGYDIRLGRNFTIVGQGPDPTCVDMFDFEKRVKHRPLNDRDSVTLYPGTLVLGVSTERFIIPRDVSVVCMAKSTLARMGIEATVTPLEAGWEGFVTIELINKIQVPIRLYSGIGIMQAQFYRGDHPCLLAYGDRGGKYQDQPALPVAAKL